MVVRQAGQRQLVTEQLERGQAAHALRRDGVAGDGLELLERLGAVQRHRLELHPMLGVLQDGLAQGLGVLVESMHRRSLWPASLKGLLDRVD